MSDKQLNDEDEEEVSDGDRESEGEKEVNGDDVKKIKRKQQKRRDAAMEKKYEERKENWEKEMKMTAKKKYKRGCAMETEELKSKYHKFHYSRQQEQVVNAAKFSARSEMLLTEDAGYLEADGGERTCEVTQTEIKRNVDITSAEKHFDLNLRQFGPYRINYTKNGKYLLMGGRLGHVAAVEWSSKKLLCEMGVMETVNDVQWLHVETMFAVAQKQWVYIYDNKGVELHCLKILDSVLRMEFLPYHFLLATSSSKGYLSWIDVSVGEKVAGYQTKSGRLDVMCQNPYNAVLALGHSSGTVTMWSPNVHEPLVKMLCHKSPIRGVSIDKSGRYMVTSGVDRRVKVWDIRKFQPVQDYKMQSACSDVDFSHTGLLACGMGNVVQVLKDCCTQATSEVYMAHRLKGSISNLHFCPYEDVIGVGHEDGFTSLIIPGAGEANFDAFESNPFETKKQRREAEVKALLEKIQPELITLDPHKLGEVDVKTLEETMIERNKLAFLKPRRVHVRPKHKTKGRSKAGKMEKRKQGIRQYEMRKHIKQVRKLKTSEAKRNKNEKSHKQKKAEEVVPPSALERFKRQVTS